MKKCSAVKLWYPAGSGHRGDEGVRATWNEQSRRRKAWYRKKLKAGAFRGASGVRAGHRTGLRRRDGEDICARAEISKKTFFNFFHRKRPPSWSRLDSFPDDEQLVRILEEHSEACYLECWSA